MNINIDTLKSSMNTQNECIMAIDIGTTKIVAIIGRVSANKTVEIEASAWKESQGVHRGTVENIEETTQSIKQCLEELYAKTKLRPREVVVGIAGQHITSLQNATSQMRHNADKLIAESEIQDMAKDMEKIGLEPGREILHITPQEYFVDGVSVRKPVGRMGSKISCTYHIVIAETASIKKIKMCIEN
ncbi:MAG: hypothetical protein ACRCZB_07725, partial [Bacteroidales bacterium]